VSVTAPLPASAASTCSASFSRYQVISQGSKGSQARALECLLRKAGYSATVNGSFSVHDAAKLAKFRASVGLNPLKVAGPRPWSALLSRGSQPVLERGDSGASVLRLQRSLRSLGYTNVSLNSNFGASTVTAVKSAQKKRGLKQTGRTSKALWWALQHGKIAAVAAPKTSTTSRGAKALAFAKKQLGDSYRYGATGPNAWDCSGLTGGAWKAAGITLPRTSQAQFRTGKKVSKSDLKPGDLVFFYSGISHVAIYAGSGKVIHASRAGRPVAYMKMSYMPYQGARRPG
jgi:cell wall-associated NlpC family hydrolase